MNSGLCGICGNPTRYVLPKGHLEFCSKTCRYTNSGFRPGNKNSAGRPKGSKNINPYPRTEAVLRRWKDNPPPSWEGKKHDEAYKEHMSKLMAERIQMNGRRLSHKGIFTPKHPEKYAGNAKNIIFRSGWELKIMHQLDQNESVISWASEELIIKYYDPIRARVRRYFPDFLVRAKTRTGEIKTTIIEIKPDYQTNLREKPSRTTQKYLQEAADVATNQAKWAAATEFAKEQGWTFVVITEKNFSF